jgi:hypothetical protein
METKVENDRIAAGTETNEVPTKQIILMHDTEGRIFVSYILPRGRFIS